MFTEYHQALKLDGVSPTWARRAWRRAPSWEAALVTVMAATLLLYAIDIVFEPVSPAVSELFQKFESSWLFFGAAILCAKRGRVVSGQRLAWWLFAFAMVLWGSASTYYGVFLWNLEVVPVPSAADAGWLAFYLPAYAALIVLLRRHAGPVSGRVWLDAFVTGLGVGGAVAALAFGVILDNTAGSTVGVVTGLAYPVADFGLLALVAAALTVTGWKDAGSWRWILAAFALFAVADSIYLVQVAKGTYAIGGIADLGWPVAALLIGVAAWRSPEQQKVARAGSSTMLPVASGVAAVALLVVDHFIPTNGLALGLATATLLVIVLRLYLAVRDNALMLAHSRIEATTDPLTGLGNRRQLTADLTSGRPDLHPTRSLILTIFDLDGFKLYNDTFGHVTGDQLLQRLGARLSATLDGRGTAYRMGGDEFCTLWAEGAETHDLPSILDDALAALSEKGEAFSIGCSWGSVRLRDEATDTDEALRLADGRMYARKRAGRASAARQSSDVLVRALVERSAELGAHIGDVASLACATATRLGVPAEDIDLVRQTALLHDVGKIAIPREILDKEGPLDAAEWAFMKRHTLIGERIIGAAPALTDVAQLVRSTHERYDGSGYPDGLAGDDIPLIAAIISVCDAYDAMTSDRSYRAALDKDDAVEELRRCSGSHFNPSTVKALITTLTATATGHAHSSA